MSLTNEIEKIIDEYYILPKSRLTPKGHKIIEENFGTDQEDDVRFLQQAITKHIVEREIKLLEGILEDGQQSTDLGYSQVNKMTVASLNLKLYELQEIKERIGGTTLKKEMKNE